MDFKKGKFCLHIEESTDASKFTTTSIQYDNNRLLNLTRDDLEVLRILVNRVISYLNED